MKDERLERENPKANGCSFHDAHKYNIKHIDDLNPTSNPQRHTTQGRNNSSFLMAATLGRARASKDDVGSPFDPLGSQTKQYQGWDKNKETINEETSSVTPVSLVKEILIPASTIQACSPSPPLSRPPCGSPSKSQAIRATTHSIHEILFPARVTLCKEADHDTPTIGWSKQFPNDSCCREAGHETPAMG